MALLTESHTRRSVLKNAMRGAAGLTIGEFVGKRTAKASGIDGTITSGFAVVADQQYNGWYFTGQSPLNLCDWDAARSGYMGTMQQFRMNWNLDAYSEYAFSKKAIPSAADINALVTVIDRQGVLPNLQVILHP